MSKDKLTDDEKSYLQRLFWDHSEKIDRKLHEELTILSKYKGELARNYHQVGGYQNTLVGCMQDIINHQEQLFFMMTDLIKVITGKYPEAKDRIDAVEEQHPWK